MYSLSPEALARIESEVDLPFLERLTHYALNESRRRAWRGVWNGHLPSGKEAQDLADDALADIIIGIREWDLAKHPDLFKFLCDVIHSELYHLATSAENRKGRLSVEQPEETKPEFVDHPLSRPDSPNACEALVSKEEEASNEALFFALHEFFAGDTLVQRVLDCIFEGTDKRADIARQLKVTEQEITNARKRMERKFPEFRETHAHLNPFAVR